MSTGYAAGCGREREAGTWPWPSPPDPGDLSRRAAQRRKDLRLTRAQVANRAGMSLRYLEYLERYPARPTGAALRRLAAALQTTPSALLGAGADVPPGQQYAADHPGLERLGPAECRRLLAPGGVGRVAFLSGAGPTVLPVNYAMAGGTIVFRTGPGTALAAHADSEVGFEVDRLDDALAQGWSVLAVGPARRAFQPAELRWLQENTAVWPWPGGDREIYVRITPERITGRRILASQPARKLAVALTPGSRKSLDERDRTQGSGPARRR